MDPASLLAIGGSFLSGIFGSDAAEDAAAAQSAAAREQLDFARETQQQTRDDLSPFYSRGVGASNALASMLGLGGSAMSSGAVPDVERYTRSAAQYSNIPMPGGRAGNPYGGGAEDSEAVRYRRQMTSPETFGWRVGSQEFDNEADATRYRTSLVNDQSAAGFQPPEGIVAPYTLGPEPDIAANPDLSLEAFEASPGYQFRMDQGLEATEGAVGRRHGLTSGATLQALNDYGQGAASQEYGNWWNRTMGAHDNTYNRGMGEYDRDYNRKATEYNNYLSRLTGVADSGQNAAVGLAGANTNANQFAANAYSNLGNAQSAGAIGSANAWSDAFENAASAWQYSDLLDKWDGSLTT